MDDLQRKSKLIELINARDNVFELANSLAGDETGHLAVALHQSNNIINRVINQLDGTDVQESITLPLIDISPGERGRIMMMDDLTR